MGKMLIMDDDRQALSKLSKEVFLFVVSAYIEGGGPL